MKYVVILVVVVLLVRIDVILRLFDKASDKITESRQTVTQPMDLRPSEGLVSYAEDKNLKQTPKQIFLALLEEFHSSPDRATREKALLYFRDHPTIFNQKLDPELESIVFSWRDLLNLNEPELRNFLIDLLNILQGENQVMVKRFFSLWMEINMENFIAAYSLTKDTNCMIITTFGDAIPEEEKLNEYYDRSEALKQFLQKEKIDPIQRALASNCQLVLGLEIAKLAPKVLPVEENGNVEPSGEEP